MTEERDRFRGYVVMGRLEMMVIGAEAEVVGEGMRDLGTGEL